MKPKTIHLGYEIGTGKPVDVPLSHLIVTGITQLSGKTTTLEALIKRSGIDAIAFRTKPGERSFSSANMTRPFFRDRSDYEFVKSLIEAYTKEKLFIEKGTLMTLCKGAGNLVEIQRRVDDAIAGGKLRGLKEEIYTRLQHYLENLIPQIKYANFSSTLDLSPGLNIMDLERFTDEAQSLIIQSVADEVLKNRSSTIIVIPEAWKFIPQKYNNPCKRSVESYIRQGAGKDDYLWLDSQDMAGVDKTTLKQISVWILGYQSERNEVKHTIDQMSLPAKAKPKEDEIMQLKIGQFFVSTSDGLRKVYVQPAWMDWKQGEVAKAIAMGKQELLTDPRHNQVVTKQNTSQEVYMGEPSTALVDLEKRMNSKLDHLAARIEKLDTPTAVISPEFMPHIIEEVLRRIPKNGSATYTVEPLKALQRQCLDEVKNRIIKEISALGDQQKKILRFIESTQKGNAQKTLLEQCLGISGTSGGNNVMIKRLTQELNLTQLIRRDDRTATSYPNLKALIELYLTPHGATQEELKQVYDHIIQSLLQ